jgi:hypothetical protein
MKKKKAEEPIKSEPDIEDLDIDDAELLEAFHELASMTPEEMEETMKDLTAMLGDDPETLAAVEEVMKEIQNMKVMDIKSAFKDLISEEEVAAATEEALIMLGQSSWEVIWEKNDFILEAVIQSGQMSAEDAAKFKSDKDAWEKELRLIWSELQKQAADVGKDEL